MKNPKTNIIGICLLATILVTLAFVWFGKATLAEAASYTGSIIGILSGIGFFMASDSKNNNQSSITNEKTNNSLFDNPSFLMFRAKTIGKIVTASPGISQN